MPSEPDETIEVTGPLRSETQRTETLAKAMQHLCLATVSGVVMYLLWTVTMVAISTLPFKFSAWHYIAIAVSGIGGAVAFCIAMRLAILGLIISLWRRRDLNWKFGLLTLLLLVSLIGIVWSVTFSLDQILEEFEMEIPTP